MGTHVLEASFVTLMLRGIVAGWLIVGFLLFPLYWMINASLQPREALLGLSPSWYPDPLILDEFHRDLRNSPYDDVSARHLRDRVIAILRQPFRIEGLSALVIEDVLEPMLFQKSDRVFKFGGKTVVLTMDDRVDVFLQ